jgi:hypothetical protein
MVRPLFGGTVLDPDVLEEQLGSRPPCVVIIISDGDITNWSRDGKRIMETLGRHYVAFIQIRDENQSGR